MNQTAQNATVHEAIARISAGVSPQQFIDWRAAAMRDHALAGHTDAAEALAIEIDRIQEAAGDLTTHDESRALWKIDNATWGNIAVHGFRVSRYFQVHPAFPDTEEGALSDARHLFKGNPRITLVAAPVMEDAA